MIKNLEELKSFMLWCKQNKIKAYSSTEASFEFSDLALLPDNNEYKEIKLEDEKTLSDIDNLTKEEYEELMYWSTNTVPKG